VLAVAPTRVSKSKGIPKGVPFDFGRKGPVDLFVTEWGHTIGTLQ